MFEVFLKQGFFVVLICSGIPLLCSSLTALSISIIQAATQVQEQTSVYLARCISMFVVLYLLSTWLWSELMHFFEEIFSAIAQLGTML